MQDLARTWIVIQEGREPVAFASYDRARAHQRHRLAEAKYRAKISIIEEQQS
jgi:hypothetical protein